jgi:hypothetical protein
MVSVYDVEVVMDQGSLMVVRHWEVSVLVVGVGGCSEVVPIVEVESL